MMPSAVFPDLKNRSVLITGGGSGIGAALTEGFVAQGARVAFIDIAEAASQDLANALDKKYGNRPFYLKADLTDIEALRNAVATAISKNGPVTVLVNNAAWDDRHDIDDVTENYWNGNQAINLRPHFFTAQAVVPGMRTAGGGSIINFTSISFMINQGNLPAYTAAKAGIIGLTKGLAGRLGPEKIRVNAIAPGWVMTERQRTHWVTQEGLEAYMKRQAIPEELLPGDMVGPCLFLASDASRMLTAQTLIVDGGCL
ncbi:NAD(P)-dependent dehydrogenase, short-chain alcohol dehydrogenase family [Phyllobacterium sp. CL33Tsu]|uniref:SDR family NAD(P)-dependent oxidoreductase n=1 Tax=Phyllobacterium sp. CL33Tsu TaxID=1798191 RepID=UPI0008EE8E6D|nr:SDR family oxidoreductase [Phyllobacterium sp. CL33Tsu]SFJ27290.1 NAD(P)-dependent dehydrogenase, short-chain alcohol dehydrogenase family [Phyllobacterium sp. CL33Tsu]